MTRPFDEMTSTATRITRRVVGVLASVLVTFTLLHEVAMLAEPAQDDAPVSHLAQAPTRTTAH